MNEKEFLEKARKHRDYKPLLEYKSAEELDNAILRIRNGYGITESYYEFTFCVEKDCLLEENPHLQEFFKDISVVFDKYKIKGIREGDSDRTGSSYPAALDIVKDTLNQI